MLKKSLAAAAMLALLSTPALASQCPADMSKIDAALAQNPDLSAEQLARVRQLRQQGEAQHEAGQHSQSVETLAEAKKILGIE